MPPYDWNDVLLAFNHRSVDFFVARSHIAIVDDQFAVPLLKGHKRIETRFSRTRRAPFGSVSAGDSIYFKASGGDFIGPCTALSVIEYDRLTPAKIDAIRRRHNHAIQAPPSYWHDRKGCQFGILIRLGSVSAPAWSGPVPRRTVLLLNIRIFIGLFSITGVQKNCRYPG